MGQIAVETVGPKMDPARRVNELPADPQPLAATADAALQNVADAQLASDLADVNRVAL